MTKAELLSVIKATLFASFGAGLGASLAISVGLGIVGLFSDSALPFDCTTLAYCGLTVANTALAILLWLIGSAGLALFASFTAYLYAFPGILLSGGALAMISRDQSKLSKLSIWLAAGAILGAAWWCLLWYMQWVPNFFHVSEGGVDYLSPWPSFQLIAAAAAGGMVAAWMFRLWWRLEAALET
jgi:hypothetical protein